MKLLGARPGARRAGSHGTGTGSNGTGSNGTSSNGTSSNGTSSNGSGSPVPTGVRAAPTGPVAALVAVVVTGSLLVSPFPTAAVATTASWLAALAALALVGTVRPEHRRPTGADGAAWWPTTLRAVLTGLILTLAVLGASRSLLQGSWMTLVASAVLVAAVVPWWLRQTEHGSPAEERLPDTGDDAETEARIRLWQSRRRVDAATFATTVGLTGVLVVTALLVVMGEDVGAQGSAPLATPLPAGWGCEVTSATFAPVAATVSALGGLAATLAAALSAHVRPTPAADVRHLAAWCVLGVVLASGATAGLGAWWLC
ncbi:hypothetical protein [Ornithinimicrobium cavernae]|uniref:hypothetical protein n=1 Tax=Ornithinimicrobium cavernae TaxID=2666047 RepID=UPI0012B163ED|nr:hypothetical protein [Ornithinimicrobium cavernae]